jgi:hypothetical protein
MGRRENNSEPTPENPPSNYCHMGSTEYELLARDVLVPFVSQIEGNVVAEHNRKMVGQSTFGHQIDVRIRSGDCLSLIECKCWNSTIPVGRVLEFCGKGDRHFGEGGQGHWHDGYNQRL